MDASDDLDATIERVLTTMRTFAVVGASPRAHRPSHAVMRTLLDHGYDAIPVTPHPGPIHGRRTYPDLRQLRRDVDVDVVDIFRRSSKAGLHVDEAIAIGAKAVWLQLGVIDHEAADRARAAGLDVVMDRCPAIELRRLARPD
jgi:uncharacterized protein